MSRISIKWSLHLRRKHILFSWLGIQFSLHTFFSSVFEDQKKFSKSLYEICVSLLTLQIPSGRWIVFLPIEKEKRSFTSFDTTLPKNGKYRLTRSKIWVNLLIRNHHLTMAIKGNVTWQCDNDQKKLNIYYKLQLQNPSLTFTQKNKSFFLVPAFYFVHLGLTTLLFSWIGQLVGTMRSSVNVKTNLDYFLGPKPTPTTWMLNFNFSRKVTTKISEFSNWHKILQR